MKSNKINISLMISELFIILKYVFIFIMNIKIKPQLKLFANGHI